MVSWKHIASSTVIYLGLSVAETFVSWFTGQGLISATALSKVGRFHGLPLIVKHFCACESSGRQFRIMLTCACGKSWAGAGSTRQSGCQVVPYCRTWIELQRPTVKAPLVVRKTTFSSLAVYFIELLFDSQRLLDRISINEERRPTISSVTRRLYLDVSAQRMSEVHFSSDFPRNVRQPGRPGPIFSRYLQLSC